VSSVCKTTPATRCWRDDQCPAGQACSGAFVCGCAADCLLADQMGYCVPPDVECCGSDADCASMGAAVHCVEGVCKSAPKAGCWTNDDCPAGGYCTGANTCRCGALCGAPDSPGTCVFPL
jgi:hypothetical protein